MVIFHIERWSIKPLAKCPLAPPNDASLPNREGRATFPGDHVRSTADNIWKRAHSRA
jgi:hypothetical protein